MEEEENSQLFYTHVLMCISQMYSSGQIDGLQRKELKRALFEDKQPFITQCQQLQHQQLKLEEYLCGFLQKNGGDFNFVGGTSFEQGKHDKGLHVNTT